MDDGLPRPCQDLPPQHLLASAVGHVSTIHGSSRSAFVFWELKVLLCFCVWEFTVLFCFLGVQRLFWFVFGSSRSMVSGFRACKLRFVNLDFARHLKRGRRGVQPIEGTNSWRAKGTLRPLNVRPPKH